jgi:hypothetical protein
LEQAGPESFILDPDGGELPVGDRAAPAATLAEGADRIVRSRLSELGLGEQDPRSDLGHVRLPPTGGSSTA